MTDSYKSLIKTSEIKISDEHSIVVRGLTFSDISLLLTEFSTEMAEIFDAVSKIENPEAQNIQSLAYDVMASMPSFFTECIYLASRKEIARSTLEELGAGYTIELIEKTLELTMETFGGPKKFAETVKRILTKILPIKS